VVAKPHHLEPRTLARMKALRARLKVTALVGNYRQRPLANDERARNADEAERLCARECLFSVNPGRGCGVK